MSIAAASVACMLAASASAGPEDGMRAGSRSPDPMPVRQPGRPAAPAEQRAAPGTANLTPSALPPVPDPDLDKTDAPPAPPPARDLRTRDPRVGTRKPAAPESEDDVPARPGAFTPAPTKLPSTLHKQRVVAPHTSSPDLELDLSKRSSVGVFGEVGRINREDIRTSTVKEGRDLGAGVTWQYKFDSR